MPHARHVAVRLVVGAGSRDDPRDKAGISHFVEHLVFRGTERHPTETALRAHLASLGARMNACTTKEWTSLDLDMSVRNLERALPVLAEVLQSPTFNGLEIERRIVLEEMSDVYDENDGSIWHVDRYADSKLWPYNALGVPVIGETRTVLNITLADAKEYVARHYLAGGIVLGIAGAVDLDALLPQIDALFGALPAGTPFKARTTPASVSGAFHHLELAGATRCYVRLVFPCVGLGPHDVRAVVTRFVLGTDGAGRIHDLLRSKTGIAYAGDADIVLHSDVGRFCLSSDVKKEKLPQLVTSLVRSLRDLREHGPRPDELAAAKECYLLALEAMHDAPADAALANAVNALYDDRPVEEEMELVRSVTPADVMEFANATFRSSVGHLVVAGPRDADDRRAAWQSFDGSLAS